MTQTNIQKFQITQQYNIINKLLNNIRILVDSKQLTKTQKLQYIDDIALQLDQFKYDNIPNNIQLSNRKLYTVLKDDDPELGLIATRPSQTNLPYNKHISKRYHATPFISFYPDMETALFEVYRLLNLPAENHKSFDNECFKIVEVDASSIIGKIIDLTSSSELLHESLGNPLRVFELLITREVSVIGYVPRNAEIYNVYHLTNNTMIDGNMFNVIDDIKNIKTKDVNKKVMFNEFKEKINHLNIISRVMSLGKPIQNIGDNVYRKSFSQTGYIEHINEDDIFILSSRDRSMNKTVDEISIKDMMFNMNFNNGLQKSFIFWMPDEDKEKYIVGRINDMKSIIPDDVYTKYPVSNIVKSAKTDTISILFTSTNKYDTGCDFDNFINHIKHGDDKFGGLTFVTTSNNTTNMLILEFSENNNKIGLELRLSPYNTFHLFKLKMELYLRCNNVYEHINTFIMSTVKKNEVNLEENVDFIKLKL